MKSLGTASLLIGMVTRLGTSLPTDYENQTTNYKIGDLTSDLPLEVEGAPPRQGDRQNVMNVRRTKCMYGIVQMKSLPGI